MAARQSVTQTINSTFTSLYWEIGRRIRRDVLQSKRAGYGEQIVSALGRQLAGEFGRGFDEKSLRHMIRFAAADVLPKKPLEQKLHEACGWLARDWPRRRERGSETQ